MNITSIVIVSAIGVLPLAAESRVMASVVPSLAYGANCSSNVQLQNLGDRTVTIELEGHRESGALVALAGLASNTIHLEPREHASYKLDIDEETTAAWAKIRETVPSPDRAPVVAITASTECLTGSQLRTAGRSVAYPTRNPWFDGDVAEMRGHVVSLINTSESAVGATLCYSSGGLFSVQGTPLQPICDGSGNVQIPPFGSRQFPVARDGNSHFSIKTHGAAIVLEMLRPLGENLHIYAVDSSIKFGDEATGKQ